MKTISKKVMNFAEELSSDWNNTGFVVLNKDGSLSATVWNKYKWEKDSKEGQRPYVASVNGNDGWKINPEYKDQYELPKSPDAKMKHTNGNWTLTNQADTWSSSTKNIVISDEVDGRGQRKVVARICNMADGKNNSALLIEEYKNAKLIASAPELLHRLKLAVEFLEHTMAWDNGELNAMQEAIKTATV